MIVCNITCQFEVILLLINDDMFDTLDSKSEVIKFVAHVSLSYMSRLSFFMLYQYMDPWCEKYNISFTQYPFN